MWFSGLFFPSWFAVQNAPNDPRPTMAQSGDGKLGEKRPRNDETSEEVSKSAEDGVGKLLREVVGVDFNYEEAAKLDTKGYRYSTDVEAVEIAIFRMSNKLGWGLRNDQVEATAKSIVKLNTPPPCESVGAQLHRRILCASDGDPSKVSDGYCEGAANAQPSKNRVGCTPVFVSEGVAEERLRKAGLSIVMGPSGSGRRHPTCHH